MKCFNCGKIGHFSAKCPYGDKDDDDQSSGSKSIVKDMKKNVYRHGRRGNWKQSSLYTHENDTIDEEIASDDCCSEGEVKENLFMAQEVLVLAEGD